MENTGSLKFIGTIKPPEEFKDHVRWGVVYDKVTDRYFAGPISVHASSLQDYHWSEPNESLASFMYMLHGDDRGALASQSYKEALWESYDRVPTEPSKNELGFGYTIDYDLIRQFIMEAIEQGSPLMTEEESHHINKF